MVVRCTLVMSSLAEAEGRSLLRDSKAATGCSWLARYKVTNDVCISCKVNVKRTRGTVSIVCITWSFDGIFVPLHCTNIVRSDVLLWCYTKSCLCYYNFCNVEIWEYFLILLISTTYYCIVYVLCVFILYMWCWMMLPC